MSPEFATAHLPQDVIDNYPYFAEFMKQYYNWNVTDGFGKILNTYKDLLYQNLTNSEYERLILKGIGIDVSLTDNSTMHNEVLYKLANEFLEARGTKVSIQMLFKMLYGKEVKVTYPRDSLFVPSNATYQRTNTILISGHYPLTIYCSLTGLKSNVVTGIESFTPYYIDGVRYYIVECINIHDDFSIGEPIKVKTIDGISFTVVHIPLININILNKGRNYKKGDIIKPSINLFDGEFVVSKVEKGSVEDVNISNGGSGYKVGDKITSKNSSGHFYAVVSSVDGNGQILSVKLNHGGYGMDILPEYTIYSTNGKGAILTLYSSTIGAVSEIKPTLGSIVYHNKNISYTANSEHGEGLQISNKVVSSYRTELHLNKKGFLGYYCDILDSYKKHPHAYDIVSNVPSDKYSSVVSKYTNPTGYVYNKKYKVVNDINISNIGVLKGEVIRK